MYPKKFKRKYKVLLKKSVKVYRRSFFARKIVKSTLFPIFILLFGLFLFTLPLFVKLAGSIESAFYIRNKTVTQEFDHGPIHSGFKKLTVNEVVGDYPVRLVIPQLKIDLIVKPSRVVNGYWEIHDDSANFGVGSSVPEEIGNTVIFAHAKYNQFGSLRKIKKDYEVSVQTKNGIWHSYKVVEKKEVKPHEVKVVGETEDKTLTLYTCSGFADSKRLIVVAK